MKSTLADAVEFSDAERAQANVLREHLAAQGYKEAKWDYVTAALRYFVVRGGGAWRIDLWEDLTVKPPATLDEPALRWHLAIRPCEGCAIEAVLELRGCSLNTLLHELPAIEERLMTSADYLLATWSDLTKNKKYD